ncbi:ICE2-domain-containing protein [Nadsonia fulvescens var. elongata DSM 6958]|uniref:ICE2-domain-containing protein n=1 Tax=Nadsonia fulvescens var. elongata DSM 6958 TaxID=857566 RepID=A0A1E3PPQ6_9ASCO|nr:ICE2-domain-containing protein [Nadsonia fulvescens var. elongata DSM 6958]
MLKSLKTVTSLFYMILIIVTVPLAFDIGGISCGLAFTFTLVMVNAIISTLRIVSRRTRFRHLTGSIYFLQHLVIPALLIVYLNIFNSTSTSSSSSSTAISTPSPGAELWARIVYPWELFITNSTPLFVISEGFCTLLLIQSAGQVSRYLVNKKSDSWMIVLLFSSSSVLSSAFYFLYRMYTTTSNVSISISAATLAGCILTCTIFLGLYGILSRKGTPVESSLIFAYIVYCLYFILMTSGPISGDVQTTNAQQADNVLADDGFIFKSPFQLFSHSSVVSNLPPLPPLLIDSYMTVVASFASLVPSSFNAVLQFFRAAVSSIQPLVFFSLAYRLFVFYSATRIIPGIQYTGFSISPTSATPTSATTPSVGSSSPSSLSSVSLSTNSDPISSGSKSLSGHQSKHYKLAHKPNAHKSMFMLYAFAPCIIIAVYTHTMIQYSTTFNYVYKDNLFTELILAKTGIYINNNYFLSWQFWSWINMISVLGIYTFELWGSKHTQDDYFSGHWKSD